MSMKYTESNEVMIGLGVNPGMVSGYSKLSVEPVSFTKSAQLGWGDEWTADHSAFTTLWADKEISVAGLSFTVNSRVSKLGGKRRFEALMKAWFEKRADLLSRQEEERQDY